MKDKQQQNMTMYVTVVKEIKKILGELQGIAWA